MVKKFSRKIQTLRREQTKTLIVDAEKSFKNLTNIESPNNIKCILSLGGNFAKAFRKSEIPVCQFITSIEAKKLNISEIY